jgi:hypothetical protein
MHGMSPMPSHIRVARPDVQSETLSPCLPWRRGRRYLLVDLWLHSSCHVGCLEVLRSTSSDLRRLVHTGHHRQGEGRSQPDEGRSEGRSRRSQGQGEVCIISSSHPATAVGVPCQPTRMRVLLLFCMQVCTLRRLQHATAAPIMFAAPDCCHPYACRQRMPRTPSRTPSQRAPATRPRGRRRVSLMLVLMMCGRSCYIRFHALPRW